MKKISWMVMVLAMVVLMLSSGNSIADLLIYEGFDYSVTNNATGLNGGTNWSAAWFNGAVDYTTIETPSLDEPATNLVTEGNRFYVFNNKGLYRNFNMGNMPAEMKETNGDFGKDGTTLWMSHLERRDTSSPDGYGYIRLGRYTGDAAITVSLAKKDSVDYWTIDTINSPIGYATNAAPADQGVTALLVTEMIFGTNATTNPDTINLYVNPDVFATTPGTPDATAIDTGIGLRVDRLFIKAGPTHSTVDRDFSFDEIRFGETYTDVVPNVGLPSQGTLIIIN